MYRSEVISVLYEQNFISFYINTLGPFSRALSQLLVYRIDQWWCKKHRNKSDRNLTGKLK